MILHVFDLDKTLLCGDSNELWHKHLLELGLLDEGFIKEDKRLMDLYAKGGLDMDTYLNFVFDALKQTSLDEINSLMDEFLEKKISPLIYPEAKNILTKAKHKLIISATADFLVTPIAKMLGVDESIGVKLLTKDGKFTGKYQTPLSYKSGKVECLKLWLKQKNLTCKKLIFYSDSINDLPLLEYAHEAHCVNPDEKLKSEAKKRKWDICEWNL